MSTLFPNAIDSFVNPQSDDLMSVVPHHTQHTDANNAIIALQTKVGANASADTNSLDYQMTHHTHSSASISWLNETIGANASVVANTAARHTHANKTTLDTYTQTQTALQNRQNHTGTQTASTISDFSEAVDDRVQSLVLAGTGIEKTYDDTANMLTLGVLANSTNQKLAIAQAGTTIGTRAKLNFIASTGMTCSIADNNATDSVDVTLSVSGGGGSFSWLSAVSGTSGTGVLLTLDNSSVADTVGQSIVIANTQTSPLTALKLSTGTSAMAHKALAIDLLTANMSAIGISLNFGATGVGKGIYFADSYAIDANNRICIDTNFNGGRTQSFLRFSNNNSTSYLFYNYGQRSGNDNVADDIAFQSNVSHIAQLTTNRTTDFLNISLSRSNSRTSGTTTDLFHLASFKRTTTQTGAGGTFVANGSVVKIENISTQIAGTLTDAVDVLVLSQSSANTLGKLATGLVGTTERMSLYPLVTDGAEAVAYFFDTQNALANAGAKLLSLRTAGVEKFCIGASGTLCNNATHAWTFGGYTTTAPTPSGYVTVTINGTDYKLVAAV